MLFNQNDALEQLEEGDNLQMIRIRTMKQLDIMRIKLAFQDHSESLYKETYFTWVLFEGFW